MNWKIIIAGMTILCKAIYSQCNLYQTPMAFFTKLKQITQKSSENLAKGPE